ncbi:uncharacterized protein LOC117747686 isoform X3 [Cyclopterus lumpus]|uniref:uncharacterized protein LOC117747686 isoform X3 n=1 Tax=Cyclopterus lumpus TaxID=8103 RepID=UPI001486D4B7|nr:uncharacterized protein LOC117747686 isoform X3 [Cyclopterus lumpus]
MNADGRNRSRRPTLPPLSNRTLRHPSFLPMFMAAGVAHHLTDCRNQTGFRLLPPKHSDTSHVRPPSSTNLSRPIQIRTIPHQGSGQPHLESKYTPPSGTAKTGCAPAYPGGGPGCYQSPETAPPRRAFALGLS